MQNYLDNDIASKVENDNPHKIVEEILKDLKNNLSLLAQCLQNNDTISRAKSDSFSKSLTAIYILQSSLDFNQGGEIAENLNKIYEFCRTTIIKSFSKKDFEAIKTLEPLINEILEGWKDIK
tara:strand:+ start:195 stop:560 length:366 start_codon:yes stop_codon:yes gene_type:complete